MLNIFETEEVFNYYNGGTLVLTIAGDSGFGSKLRLGEVYDKVARPQAEWSFDPEVLQIAETKGRIDEREDAEVVQTAISAYALPPQENGNFQYAIDGDSVIQLVRYNWSKEDPEFDNERENAVLKSIFDNGMAVKFWCLGYESLDWVSETRILAWGSDLESLKEIGNRPVPEFIPEHE
ncbi:MAG TPA: hypothetical protein VFV50_06150 [Bdellovibrionales bacterium]|nr:hypothetical protein [Bdellovibrionales bacterium]